jgi:hypothetical protein
MSLMARLEISGEHKEERRGCCRPQDSGCHHCRRSWGALLVLLSRQREGERGAEVSVSLSRATAVFGERGFVSGFRENRAVFDKIELYFFVIFT